MPSSLLVTLCTYNEAENLPGLIEEIHRQAPQSDVLIVDDNSPDGTGAIADELHAADKRIQVLHRAEKKGLGAATRAGFEWAIAQGYELIINMDADFSHHPRHLPALIAGIESVDVMIGSRYVSGGGVAGWGWRRKLMSGGINTYARLMLGLNTKDNSGSYRCYRTALLKQINWSHFRSRGYAFQEEILFHCRMLGARFAETPIVFEDRDRGHSKLDRREILTALHDMLQLGLDRLTGRARRATRRAKAEHRASDGP